MGAGGSASGREMNQRQMNLFIELSALIAK